MAGTITSDHVAKFLSLIPNFLALPSERKFHPDALTSWTSSNWTFVISLVAIYLIFIKVGPMVMASREAYDLRMPLAAWNAFLCLFSFLGMCRTVPSLLANVLSMPFEQTICASPTASWGSGPTGFWVMLFIFSKIPELIDTIFIVLRKKPLIFLHWYHHVTVLLFCWSSYATLAGSGLYFVAMNYTVHAMMYGYYCLQALNLCPKSFPAFLITFSQISQMFVGTGVCISAWYFMLAGHTCSNDLSNLVAGALMYGSYLYLFCEFAFKRYGPGKKSRKGVTAETPKKLE